MRLPLCRPPKARSDEPAAPKLYVSPPVPLPVPAVYVVLAFVPLSLHAQPAGTVLEVPVVSSVSKLCVYAVSGDVRSMPVADDDAPPIETMTSASMRTALEMSARRRVTGLSLPWVN